METTDSINPVEAITAAVEAQAHTTDIGMLAIKSVNDTLVDASKEPRPGAPLRQSSGTRAKSPASLPIPTSANPSSPSR